VFTCLLVDAFVWRTARRAIVAFLVLCLFHPFGSTHSSAASIRAQLEGFELTAESPTGLEWQKAAALFSALRAIGEEPPELPELAAEVARAIDARVEAPDDVWVAAERMGLIRDEDRKRLVAQRLGGTFDGLGWVGELELGPTFWFSKSALAFVLMAPRLTGEARALAAERLDPGWPATDERDALRRAAALDELAKVKAFKDTKCFKSEHRILAQAIKILDNKSSQEILFPSKEGSLGFMGSGFCLASISKTRRRGKFPSMHS
jgi:hypothetical protein